jgi:hypothetical protein
MRPRCRERRTTAALLQIIAVQIKIQRRAVIGDGLARYFFLGPAALEISMG